jgi:hypothetical protein
MFWFLQVFVRPSSLKVEQMNALVPRLAMAAVVALASFPVPAAGRQARTAQPRPTEAGVGVTAVIRQPGTVTGIAWHRDNTPVSHALLRLRDVTAGRIVGGTQADAAGRFSFTSVPAGSYIVELVDEDGAVRGLGQVFGVGPGETVATFIRLGTQVPWFNGFFSNAAAAVLASAAAIGVTAVGNGDQPASARF